MKNIRLLILLVLLLEFAKSIVYVQKKSINNSYKFNSQDSIFALIPIINSVFFIKVIN